MTPEQRAIVKAYILATPALAAVASGPGTDYDFIAKALSAEAAPAFYLWRSQYTPEQIADAIEIGITQLDGLAASKREVLLWWAQRPHNAANSQAAIDDMCGSQNTLKAAVIAGGKRKANQAEKLLATGGNGAVATPATPTFEGDVQWSEIGVILA